MQDLLEITHFLTRVKVAPAAQGFFDGGSGEAKRAGELAAKLSVASLTRAWQMLLKGLFEVRDATRPILACEMALIRLAYAAELPPTDKLVRDLLDDGALPAPRGAVARAVCAARCAPSASRARLQPRAAADPDGAPVLQGLEDIALLAANHAPVLKVHIENDIIWCGWSRAGWNSVPARAPRAPWRAICSRNCATGPACAGASRSPAKAARPPWPSRRKTPRRRASKA